MVDFPVFRPSQRGVGGDSFSSGLQAGANVLALRNKREAQQYIEPALSGDQAAFGKLASGDPQAANSVATMLSRLDTRKQAAVKEAAEFTTQIGMGVLNAPPDQQASAFASARAEAQRRGMDISSWPTQWGPQAQGWVQFNVNKAIPVQEWFKGQEGKPTPIGPGAGTPSAAPSAPPTASGDPAAAISSIESGGKYDAVGPVADGKGSRAYGKYQIMDFNVGPWTQEVLGKPMTPQEFLANPQAQDAVFKAKFGQYRQKYGDEGAAKAWFAGEGGMNNPNAADVNGMTVQRYGQKFTQALGGPQPQVAQAGPQPGFSPTNMPAQSLPGGLPQMPTGAAPPNASGQGDSAPGMPQGAPPPPEVRGMQLPPGVRMMGIKGVPVVKDGTVLVQKQDGSLDWVPLPQRQEAPGGYRRAADGSLEPIPGGPADPMRQRALNLPPGYQIGPGGALTFIPGGPADPAQARALAEARRKAEESGGGPFGGTGMDQQAYNIVLQGDPSTPAYAAAHAHLASPRVQFDAQTGQAITIRPDMSWARPPMGVQATPPGVPPAAAPPAGQPGPQPQPASPPAQSGGVTIERVMDPKKSEAFKKLETDVRAVDSAITRFQSIIDETRTPDRWRAVINDPTSAEAQKLLGAFNALKTALRSEAFVNTGVLQPAEMKMLDDMLLAPNTIRGGMATPEAYKAMLGEFRQFIEGKIAAGYAVNGITPQGGKAVPEASKSATPSGPPRLGEVQDGYLFKGGDPSKPESWEKVAQ